jgi:RNA polymerase sigma factor (sigma-70 family)
MSDVDLIPTRASLLSQLKDPENDASWRIFFDTYGKLIYGAAVKAGLNRTEAQEVVQETVLCVARKIPGFNYDPAIGSFKGWLFKLTSWRIRDQFRKRRRDETSLSSDERISEVEAIGHERTLDSFWEGEWERSILEAALARVKQLVDPKQYQVFYESVIKQTPVKDVCRRLKVSAGNVYLIKHRIGGLVKRQIEKVKKENYL